LDFVTGIFDAKGRWVASKDYIPVLAGSMPAAYAAVSRRFEGDVEEGDIFLLNDPFSGNNHPPDVTLLKPVFHHQRLSFWVVSKGHHADVGGNGVVGYNPNARDCWEDALRIPPVRLVRRGEFERDIWDLVLCNVRLREYVEGDLLCQIGALNVGEQDIHGLLETIGSEVVDTAIDDYLDSSARHMRREVEALPDGAYEAERIIENGGSHHRHPVVIRLTLRIHGSQIEFDYRASDPQVQGYVNSTLPNTVASTLIGLFGVVDPDLPMNQGSIEPVTVITEQGTVVDALEPAATTLCTLSTCEAIVEAVWSALAVADPAISNAGWSRFGGVGETGVNKRTGSPFAAISLCAWGGAGATEGADGWDVIGTPVVMGGSRSIDPELHELVVPVTLERVELDVDSAGAGRWRGGLGSVLRWRVDQDDVTIVYYGSGTDSSTAPFGLAGGDGAHPNWTEITRADGSVERLTVNSIIVVHEGDVIETHNSGGGGFGPAHARPISAVLEDVRAGVVSVDAAFHDYRVLIDGEVVTDLRAAVERTTATPDSDPIPLVLATSQP